MTAKQIRFYQTLLEFARQDFTSDAYLEFLTFALEHDFATGIEMWEALFVINEEKITSPELKQAVSLDSFYLFLNKAEQRTIKAVSENPALARAVFQYAPEGIDTFLVKMISDFVLANKTKSADECLKALFKNTAEVSFGAQMKQILEKLFVEVLKRVGGGKTALTKKQTTLLQTHINKIKTPEKALLTQRLKEIS